VAFFWWLFTFFSPCTGTIANARSQDWSMHEYPLNLCSYCYQLQQEMGELRRDAALLPACSSGCRSIETGFRQGVLMLNDADLCTLINGSCVGSLQAGTKNSIMCGNGTLCHARKYSLGSVKKKYNSRCIHG